MKKDNDIENINEAEFIEAEIIEPLTENNLEAEVIDKLEGNLEE